MGSMTTLILGMMRKKKQLEHMLKPPNITPTQIHLIQHMMPLRLPCLLIPLRLQVHVPEQEGNITPIHHSPTLEGKIIFSKWTVTHMLISAIWRTSTILLHRNQSLILRVGFQLGHYRRRKLTLFSTLSM